MNVTVSKERMPFSYKDLTVVYAPSPAQTEGYIRVIQAMASALGVKAEAEAQAQETAREIVVGSTARKESAEALALLSGKHNAFAIAVFGERIALVGTDTPMLLMAVQYFRQHYAGVKTLPLTTVVEEVATIKLADAQTSYATYVYGAQLYDKPYHPIPELVYTYRNWEMRDMPCVLVDTLIKSVSEQTGLIVEENFIIQKDSAPPAALEVIVGISSRPDSRAALQALDGGEYTVCVQEGSMVITGWNYASLELAHQLFVDLTKEASACQPGEISLPVGLSFTDTANAAWIVDFPKPQGEGIVLYNTLDTNDASLQYLYTGEGVHAQAFRAYCALLCDNGYTLVMENELEGSLFQTLVNEERGVMLYVAYEAYAHREEYAPPFTPSLRIVSSPLHAVSVPPADIIQGAPAYRKVTNSAVTNVEVTGRAIGMGYILTLEDGSFIVFDGGGLNPDQKEPQRLWHLLNIRYQQIYHTRPTPENPIRVTAWIITHSHWDHYGAFRVFIDTYGKSELFSLRYMIGNFPSRSAVFGIVNEDILNMGKPEVMQRLHDGMREDFTFLKVHAGQKYYFANLEMEVLMTYDNISPARIYNQNDTSTVLRFSLQATNESGEKVGEPYVMLWLGDANNNESRFLCAMYGAYLQSDSVSVAHHGNIGCETDLYNTVKATTVWWPHTVRAVKSYLAPESRTKSWVYDVDYTLINENPHTRYVYCSGSYERIDENTIVPFGLHLTLPFGDDGKPAHEEIYDTVRGKAYKIPYTTDTVACSVAMRIEHK